MRVLGAVVLLAAGAAAGVALDRYLLRDGGDPPGALSGVERRSPTGPDDPPVVWVDGRLRELGQDHLTIRKGRGPEIRLERLAEGATSFLRHDDSQWRVLTGEEIAALGAGERACVESLLDGRLFLALQVFVGVGCGPAP